MAYLTCKNLTLGYEGHAIVSDLNFKVGKGDYLCIITLAFNEIIRVIMLNLKYYKWCQRIDGISSNEY